jgi:hypothetical protein
MNLAGEQAISLVISFLSIYFTNGSCFMIELHRIIVCVVTRKEAKDNFSTLQIYNKNKLKVSRKDRQVARGACGLPWDSL